MVLYPEKGEAIVEISMAGEGQQENKREWLKFQALVVGLIWFLVFLALLRPLVFQRVLPSVLGLNLSRAAAPLRAEIEWAKPGVEILLPAAAPESAADAGRIRHVVREGDTLYRIAIRYDVSAESVAQLNHIVHPGRLVVGQVLAIPEKTTADG